MGGVWRRVWIKDVGGLDEGSEACGRVSVKVHTERDERNSLSAGPICPSPSFSTLAPYKLNNPDPLFDRTLCSRHVHRGQREGCSELIQVTTLAVIYQSSISSFSYEGQSIFVNERPSVTGLRVRSFEKETEDRVSGVPTQCRMENLSKSV